MISIVLEHIGVWSPDSFIPDSSHSTGPAIVPDGERTTVDKAVLLGDYMA